jgi:predicted nuclease of predicted toxin-antitoxin system
VGGGTQGTQPVRVLLDEQLSGLIARMLRERGLDAQAVVERPDLLQAADREVMEAARREGRAVVTNNVKDFRPLAADRLADGRGHAGLILLRARRSRARGATGSLADAIETVMSAHPEGIASMEHWIA